MSLARMALTICFALGAAAAAEAQVLYQPTPPPEITAADRSWYSAREPIFFAGDLYYPAGPTVYFDGHRMVPTGSHDGVTLYADTTVEPYSVVFVPAGGRLMRPYERRRAGAIAGTTGSSIPSRPVQPAGLAGEAPEAAGVAEIPADRMEATAGVSGSHLVVTSLPPSGNAGVWIEFRGHRWRSAGRAVAVTGSSLTAIGEYRGFTVYAARGGAREPDGLPSRIYLPTLSGVAAPYERAAER